VQSKADKESGSRKDKGKDRGKEKGKTSHRTNNRSPQANTGRPASAKPAAPAVGTFGALLQNATKAKK